MAESTDPVDLADLIARVAMGDRDAFRNLYQQTSSNLFGGLMRILKEPGLAEDALQETYVKVWSNADRYRPASGEPMTWMHSIARYRAIDMLRKRKHDQQQTPVDSPAALADQAMMYLDRLPDVDQSTLVRCLDELEEPQKNAIVMCYCEGYSHGELSEILTRPLGTIKSWIRRGLQVLKNCIEP